MEGISVLLRNAVLTVLAFFVVAPCVLNAISAFGAQQRFAERMAEAGIVGMDDVRAVLKTKKAVGVVLSAVLLAGLLFFASTRGMFGWICAAAGLLLGALRYRGVLQVENPVTAKRFRDTFASVMDEKKYNAYVDEHF